MSTSFDMEEVKSSDRVMSPVEIFALIKDDLLHVEQEFGNQVNDASPLVASVVKYLLESGGKRVRPALVLLASRLVCGEAVPAAVRMGSVMEMLHTATLVHDDI